MFVDFDATNSVNIGKEYRVKFGDPEEYFGKSESSLNNSDVRSNEKIGGSYGVD